MDCSSAPAGISCEDAVWPIRLAADVCGSADKVAVASIVGKSGLSTTAVGVAVAVGPPSMAAPLSDGNGVSLMMAVGVAVTRPG